MHRQGFRPFGRPWQCTLGLLTAYCGTTRRLCYRTQWQPERTRPEGQRGMPVEQEACASTTLAEGRGKSMEKVLEAANLVKLGNAAELTRCLASLSEASDLNHRDPEGGEITSSFCAPPLLITIFLAAYRRRGRSELQPLACWVIVSLPAVPLTVHLQQRSSAGVEVSQGV